MFNRINIIAIISLIIFVVMAKGAAQSDLPSYAKYKDLQKNPRVQGK